MHGIWKYTQKDCNQQIVASICCSIGHEKSNNINLVSSTPLRLPTAQTSLFL